MNSKKSIRKTFKRSNKSHKSHKKNNKNKLKSRKTVKKISRKQNKILSKTLKRKQKGGECEYLKVEGMKLPDLTIPDQYGLLFDNC